MSRPASGHIAIEGSAAPTTSSSEEAACSCVRQCDASEPSTAMAERPRTNRASLVLISRLAPLRNSVTSPVVRTTSAARGRQRNAAECQLVACRRRAGSRLLARQPRYADASRYGAHVRGDDMDLGRVDDTLR